MSVTVHVDGLRLADADHKAKVAALKACLAAKIEVPKALEEYFGDHGYEDTDGALCVDIDKACKGEVAYDDGMLIDLRKLPAGVVHLRVSMS